MDKNPDEFIEVIDPKAFDGKLPARVPVTQYPGGPVIEGAEAEVTKDEDGLVVSVKMPGKPDRYTGSMSFRPDGG